MGNEIGKLLKQMRKASGMTQVKLAERMGVTYQQVQKYESGKSTFSIGRLLQVAEVFDIPPSAFLDVKQRVEQPEPEYSSLSECEVLMVLMYRRLGTRTLQKEFLNMLENIVNIRGLS